MQDWEIEQSDGRRLMEFIDAYDTLVLDDDERFALMGLIVASSHDALDFYGLTNSQWRLVHDRLVADASLHASTIYYWCCVDATCDDECFTLTPRMRLVWNAAFGSREPIPETPGIGEPDRDRGRIAADPSHTT